MKIAIMETSAAGNQAFHKLIKTHPNNDIQFVLFKVDKRISAHTDEEKLTFVNERLKPVIKKGNYDLVYLPINSLSFFLKTNKIDLGPNVVTVLQLHDLVDKKGMKPEDYIILANDYIYETKALEPVYPGVKVTTDNKLKEAISSKDENLIKELSKPYEGKTIIPGCSDFEMLEHYGFEVIDLYKELEKFNITNNSEKKHSLQDVITKDMVIEACVI